MSEGEVRVTCDSARDEDTEEHPLHSCVHIHLAWSGSCRRTGVSQSWGEPGAATALGNAELPPTASPSVTGQEEEMRNTAGQVGTQERKRQGVKGHTRG